MYSIYCDESCHLINDHQQSMMLGSIWCPSDQVREINQQIRAIQKSYYLKNDFEIKWTKVSPGRVDFYLALVDFFFDSPHLHFRGVVIPDKSKINHDHFQQDHDTWYYKMYYEMLKVVIDTNQQYRIYLDIKDTNSSTKVAELHQVLCNKFHDFDGRVIQRIQQIRSHEVSLLQLTDLIMGAVNYLHRDLTSSPAKLALVNRIQQRSGLSLRSTTSLFENKVNLLIWHASEVI